MDKHTIVCGITRSGKTYYIEKMTQGQNNFKLDIKDELEGKKVTGKNTIEEIKYCIESYKNVRFVPDLDDKKREKQVDILCKILMQYREKMKINFIVDEAFEYIKQGKSQSGIYTIARRGLNTEKKGVRLILASQSMADVDKKAIKQCENIVVFKLNEFDYNYIKNIGFDGKKVKEWLENKKYWYCKNESGIMILNKPI